MIFLLVAATTGRLLIHPGTPAERNDSFITGWNPLPVHGNKEGFFSGHNNGTPAVVPGGAVTPAAATIPEGHLRVV